jgi:hypothetical protein
VTAAAEDWRKSLGILEAVTWLLVRTDAPAERERLGRIHAETLAGLKQLRRRPGTHGRIAHLRKLEAQLADMPAGERAAAIQERMGISRSRYYQIKQEVGISSTRKAGLGRGLMGSMWELR